MDEIRYWIETEGAGHWFFIAFPVVLLCLFIWFKGRRVRFLIPSLLMSIIIINPLFFKYWDKLGLYAYWRILWVVPVVPVVAGLVPSISEKFEKTWVKSIVAAAGVGLVMFGGTFLYNGAGGSFVEAANASKLPDYVVQIADRLLELDDHPRVIAQDPIGIYIRQYTGQIDILYGRDLYGYITRDASDEAKMIHGKLSNGDMSLVAQFMLDNDYDYLVFNGELGENFYIIETVEDYGVYKAIGKPTVTKVRNKLGQITALTTINENGDPVNNSNGYATVHKEYDSYNNVIEEWYEDANGNALKHMAGYTVIKQKWGSNGELYERLYCDADGKRCNRIDGYAKATWVRDSDGIEDVHFYDVNDREIPIAGINLVQDVEVGNDGWSEWIIPEENIENSCCTIGCFNLGDKKSGDFYTFQAEVEFRNVKVTNGMNFLFLSQGAADGKWETGNPWNYVIKIYEEPSDGIYSFAVSKEIDEKMMNASTFDIGFRCDYWSSGMFRVRNLKIVCGDKTYIWSPGI